MPNVPPDDAARVMPRVVTLGQGTTLTRMHSAELGAIEFNHRAANDPYQGGRFDSVDGEYGYLYAGQDADVAVAEVLLRDVPPGQKRYLPCAAVRGRMLSEIVVGHPLDVVSLRGRDLGHIGQDTWLTKSEAADYPFTRRWAKAIRGWAPRAAGFAWRARHDEDREAYVLFDDRTPPGSLVFADSSRRTDAGVGLKEVRRILAGHNVMLDCGGVS